MDDAGFEKGPYLRHCTLCLMRSAEVESFLHPFSKKGLTIGIDAAHGFLRLAFKGEPPVVDGVMKAIEERFATFFVGDSTVEEAIHLEMISQKKTLALAESCTGGAIASRIVSVPGASQFFLGSIVAYANSWKERFLGVRRDTLDTKGSVSRDTVYEMIEGLFHETDADYAVGVSGRLGPFEETFNVQTGIIFIAVAKRGEKIDIGQLSVGSDRKAGLELAVQTALGALWRRIAHNTLTFS